MALVLYYCTTLSDVAYTSALIADCVFTSCQHATLSYRRVSDKAANEAPRRFYNHGEGPVS